MILYHNHCHRNQIIYHMPFCSVLLYYYCYATGKCDITIAKTAWEIKSNTWEDSGVQKQNLTGLEHPQTLWQVHFPGMSLCHWNVHHHGDSMSGARVSAKHLQLRLCPLDPSWLCQSFGSQSRENSIQTPQTQIQVLHGSLVCRVSFAKKALLILMKFLLWMICS